MLIALQTQAQLTVHYHSEHLFLNTFSKQLSGTVNITIKNTGDSTINHVRILYWPLAYKQQGTKLANELLENQNAKMRFAKPEDLGNGFSFLDSAIVLESEMTVLPVNLPPGEEITLKHGILQVLPHARYNGYGVDESSIRLSHWLPRISAAKQPENDTYNSINREAWFYPATYNLNLIVFKEGKLATNLDVKQELIDSNSTTYHLVNESPSYDALILLLNGGNSLPVKNDSSSILLHFVDDFPAFNTNSSWSNVADFLNRELGWKAPENLNLVFLENRSGIQSAGSCLVLEKNNTQENVEGDLIEELVKVYARENLGVNPAEHPFLVEGLGNYYKHLYYNRYYPDKMLLGPLANTLVARFFDVDHYPVSYQNRMLYLYMVRQGLDQPLSDPANAYSRFNREAVIKGKSALWFSYLRSYVGEKNFLRGMRRWQQTSDGSPESLIAAMRYYHNQDLSWLLADLYTTAKKLDYKLKKTENCTSVYTATIKNKGDLSIPFAITGYKNGKPVLTEWNPGFEGKKTIQIHLEDYTEVKLDAEEAMPETSQKNNDVRTSGLFRNMKPLKFQFYTSFENPDRTQIFWLPSVKYNAYDKLLLGAQFTNANLFRKPIEWKLAPDYSTGTGSLTGMGSIRFNWTPYDGVFHLVSFGIYGKYYHYAPSLAYTRLSPTLTLNFRKPYPRSEWINTLRIRAVIVDRETSPVGDGGEGIQIEGPPGYQIIDVRYRAEKGSLLTPFIGNADIQFADEFIKMSIEVKQRWRFSKNHLLTARVFAGTMLHYAKTPDPFFQFGFSGTRDYLFDYYFIGRSDQTGIWSQQMFFTDGGFRTQTNAFTTSMIAANINLPFYRFVGAFGDLGYSISGNEFYWDYGLYLEFIPDFIEVHFPIGSSLVYIPEAPKYAERIRFVLNLELDAIMNRIRRGWY